MEQLGTYRVAAGLASTDAGPSAPNACVAVTADELRQMRAEVVAVKASVDHLLQLLTELITTAQAPAE